MHRLVTASALAFALLSGVPAASAQPIYSVSEARAIAVDNGIRVLYRIRLDEGVWKIEGRDVTGRFVYMRIDPVTGQVVQLDRGW